MNHLDTPTSNSGPVEELNSTTSCGLMEYYEKRLEHARQHLPEAARQLKEIGVVSIEVYYDGCGDSGQIESIHYFDANYRSIDPAGRVTITDEELMNLFYDLLEVRQAGWENNDGAFGSFDWNLTTDYLNHTHSMRYTECETTEYEGL
jgi:hypothetical protein